MQSARRKTLGAYYTSESVADFLCRWAIRPNARRILDPSCGDGVFLRAAGVQIGKPRVSINPEIVGVDVDEIACRSARLSSAAIATNARTRVICSDFFSLDDEELGAFDAVVGNPPFIRYQRFNGESRARALQLAAIEGVRLPQLASSWAPFVVRSAALVNTGGRLAMVAPTEMIQATYARPVLRFLCRSFARVVLITFEKRLFPDLSEDTLLVLGEDKGGAFREFRLLNLGLPEQLLTLLDVDEQLLAGRTIAPPLSDHESHKIVEYFLPESTRQLYRRLAAHSGTCRLGDGMDVGIGYVSGDNSFFHMSEQEARTREIPEALLCPTVRKGADLAGITFRSSDWKHAADEGRPNLLFKVDPRTPRLPAGAHRYVVEGESRNVHRAFKCSVRDPWFAVPHVTIPDGFLTYMTGLGMRLVSNEAKCAGTNSVHVCRLRSRSDSFRPWAGAFQTSLTMLSAEIEGRSLGGGMLKVEPRDARSLLVVDPRQSTASDWTELVAELDDLIRQGRTQDALDLGDREILRGALGLDLKECQALRRGYLTLAARRMNR